MLEYWLVACVENRLKAGLQLVDNSKKVRLQLVDCPLMFADAFCREKRYLAFLFREHTDKDVTVANKTSLLTYARIAYFSGPASERILYRKMKRLKPRSILEIGLGLGVRSLRMLDVARRFQAADQIQYTGIDLFEARSVGAQFSLKNAYKLFRGSGAKIKLVPGDALMAMTQTANALSNTDLIVIDSDIADGELQDAWKYFPRMMHERTLVLRQESKEDQKRFRTIKASDIEKLITSGSRRAA